MTAYVTTLLVLPPVEAEAAGTICVSVAGTEAPAAVTETVADWPTLREVISDSVKLAVATIGPIDSSTAYVDGALTPGRMLTAMINPSAGATMEAPVTAAWSASTVAWAEATLAWSAWTVVLEVGAVFVWYWSLAAW